KIQRKFETNFINPILLQIVSNSVTQYLPQNTVELLKTGGKINIPPHIYPEIFNEIIRFYNLEDLLTLMKQKSELGSTSGVGRGSRSRRVSNRRGRGRGQQ
ncbi:hypothetical protein Mgra_00006575, partial [Meloidogyne graminicola]